MTPSSSEHRKALVRAITSCYEAPARDAWFASFGDGRRIWTTAYRNLRELAAISCNAVDTLVAIRGYGPLKKVWHGQTCIGRMRFNDVRHPDFTTRLETLGNAYPFTDYAPSRIIKNNHC
jgi:hypothetical protein